METELLPANDARPPDGAPVLSPALVGRTLARLARQVELGAASAELSLSQYRVLSILDSGQEAASSLADKLAVSRPSVTGVVDGLVARGLVRRENVGTDRRRVDVGLTEEGASVIASAEVEIQRRLDAIAAFMEPVRVADASGTSSSGSSSSGSSTSSTPITVPADPYSALVPWHLALNAYRKARHGRS